MPETEVETNPPPATEPVKEEAVKEEAKEEKKDEEKSASAEESKEASKPEKKKKVKEPAPPPPPPKGTILTQLSLNGSRLASRDLGSTAALLYRLSRREGSSMATWTPYADLVLLSSTEGI